VIPQVEPWIGEEELQQVIDAIKSTWLTENQKTVQFEQMFAALVGAKHAIAVNNATGGLFVCLKALDIGTGDEVIVPSLTFVATVNSVIMAGAEPVLADIDPKTFNMDPNTIEAAITPKTKAIMPVHLYGQAADMEAIFSVAHRRGLQVVEDAAQGVGVKFRGQHVGIWGNLACFSFFGNKTLTTGQGGMITTNDDVLAEKCLLIKNHGRTTRATFIHDHIGYNFCFSELQAAIGLAQMSKLDRILAGKQRNLEIYRAQLKEVAQIRFPEIDPRCEAVAWFSNILVDDPQALADYLWQRAIQTRRFFYPIHRQPCYRRRFSNTFPHAEQVYERGLSLPSSATLQHETLLFVCENIKAFYALAASKA
jgi:perosamine synthetase